MKALSSILILLLTIYSRAEIVQDSYNFDYKNVQFGIQTFTITGKIDRESVKILKVTGNCNCLRKTEFQKGGFKRGNTFKVNLSLNIEGLSNKKKLSTKMLLTYQDELGEIHHAPFAVNISTEHHIPFRPISKQIQVRAKSNRIDLPLLVNSNVSVEDISVSVEGVVVKSIDFEVNKRLINRKDITLKLNEVKLNVVSELKKGQYYLISIKNLKTMYVAQVVLYCY